MFSIYLTLLEPNIDLKLLLCGPLEQKTISKNEFTKDFMSAVEWKTWIWLIPADLFQMSDGEVEGAGGREGEGRDHRVPGELIPHKNKQVRFQF